MSFARISDARGPCAYCKKAMHGGRRDRKYCNAECARLDTQRRWREQNPKSPLAAQRTGAVAEANEMLVAIDLLTRGYEVYRSAFPAQGCDMIIRLYPEQIHNIKRIEVTSGSYTPSGTLVHPDRDESKFDVLAVVVAGKIVYKPEL